MTQHRHIWRLCMFEWTASTHNGGWLVSAFVGTMEVYPETYFEGSIGSIMERSADWTRDLSEELVIAANDLEIE